MISCLMNLNFSKISFSFLMIQNPFSIFNVVSLLNTWNYEPAPSLFFFFFLVEVQTSLSKGLMVMGKGNPKRETETTSHGIITHISSELSRILDIIDSFY